MSRSRRGLDGLNFFVADVQTGFGPFIAVYLTTQAWTEVEIGFALSLGTLTALLSQVPAGAIVDAVRDKRRIARVALVALAMSAVLLAAFPARLPVYASEVLHGFASCLLNPSIAAISLALVGRKLLAERLGRNTRFASLGGAMAAGIMGLIGTYVSPEAVFWMTAALTVPSLICLNRIRARDLRPPAPNVPPQPMQEHEPSGVFITRGGSDQSFRDLLHNRAILVFAMCAMLFTLSNAAMMPLAAATVTRRAGDEANLIIAACIVIPQLVVVGISPWVGRIAQKYGRRITLLLGFAALPLRGVMLATVEAPTALILIQAIDGFSAATLNVMLPLLAADLTRGTNRFNLCLGFFGLAVSIGGLISTTLGGAIASWRTPNDAFLVLAGIGLLCLLTTFFAMPETRDEPSHGVWHDADDSSNGAGD